VFGVCYIQQPFDNNIGCAASYGRMALKLWTGNDVASHSMNMAALQPSVAEAIWYLCHGPWNFEYQNIH
jgi:hypothetical protein